MSYCEFCNSNIESYVYDETGKIIGCGSCCPAPIDPERLALVCAALTGICASGPKARGETTERQLQDAICQAGIELADITLAELRKPKEPRP